MTKNENDKLVSTLEKYLGKKIIIDEKELEFIRFTNSLYTQERTEFDNSFAAPNFQPAKAILITDEGKQIEMPLVELLGHFNP